jgi:hypothetical protein
MLKKSFVDFKKEYVLQKIEIVVHIQISILFLLIDYCSTFSDQYGQLVQQHLLTATEKVWRFGYGQQFQFFVAHTLF